MTTTNPQVTYISSVIRELGGSASIAAISGWTFSKYGDFLGHTSNYLWEAHEVLDLVRSNSQAFHYDESTQVVSLV